MISLGDLYKIVEQPKIPIKTQISEILKNSLNEKIITEQSKPKSKKKTPKALSVRTRKKISLTENDMIKFRECFE